ncbi:glycosyltransferase family 1 protein [Clostridium sediminicola]|uniref:glycosyltransferase family 4 protein n=1 Tax=Clostridium sediminicola TaxID=3114879 RepID=UPI0031F1D75B
MKIAIDARGINLYKGTGIGTYTEKLLLNLINYKENYYKLFWTKGNRDSFSKSNVDITLTASKSHKFFNDYYIPNNLNNSDVQIYHVPQNGIGLNESINCKKVITVHDLIPYLMPETVGKGYIKKFLAQMPKIIDLCDGILTVSNCSKNDIIRFFNVDEDKIFVTPLAADSKYKPLNKHECIAYTEKKFGIQKPFLLYIGGFSQRKNVKELILAFLKTYKSLKKDYCLVIGGSRKDLGQKLYNQFNHHENIMFTGYIESFELPILYNAADLFVYPSLYEGFGLPPLEAMKCGTPVITSNLSSIPEVVKDAGILINPYKRNELQEAIVKILNNDDLRLEYIKRSLERAKDFNWQKTATITENAYRTIIESN